MNCRKGRRLFLAQFFLGAVAYLSRDYSHSVCSFEPWAEQVDPGTQQACGTAFPWVSSVHSQAQLIHLGTVTERIKAKPDL